MGVFSPDASSNVQAQGAVQTEVVEPIDTTTATAITGISQLIKETNSSLVQPAIAERDFRDLRQQVNQQLSEAEQAEFNQFKGDVTSQLAAVKQGRKSLSALQTSVNSRSRSILRRAPGLEDKIATYLNDVGLRKENIERGFTVQEEQAKLQLGLFNQIASRDPGSVTLDVNGVPDIQRTITTFQENSAAKQELSKRTQVDVNRSIKAANTIVTNQFPNAIRTLDALKDNPTQFNQTKQTLVTGVQRVKLQMSQQLANVTDKTQRQQLKDSINAIDETIKSINELEPSEIDSLAKDLFQTAKEIDSIGKIASYVNDPKVQKWAKAAIDQRAKDVLSSVKPKQLSEERDPEIRKQAIQGGYQAVTKFVETRTPLTKRDEAGVLQSIKTASEGSVETGTNPSKNIALWSTPKVLDLAKKDKQATSNIIRSVTDSMLKQGGVMTEIKAASEGNIVKFNSTSGRFEVTPNAARRAPLTTTEVIGVSGLFGEVNADAIGRKRAKELEDKLNTIVQGVNTIHELGGTSTKELYTAIFSDTGYQQGLDAIGVTPERSTEVQGTTDDLPTTRTQTPEAIVEEEEESATEALDTNLDLLVQFEGGFVNDPRDRGGRTNLGITQTTLSEARKKDASLPVDVADLSETQARRIYTDMFWKRNKLDGVTKEAPEIASVLFDAYVNGGGHQMAKFVQRELGIKVDGILGPNTQGELRLLNRDQQLELAAKIINQREDRFRQLVAKDPSQQRFLNGWLNRLQQLSTALGLPVDPTLSVRGTVDTATTTELQSSAKGAILDSEQEVQVGNDIFILRTNGTFIKKGSV